MVFSSSKKSGAVGNLERVPRRIPSAIYKAESGLGNTTDAGKPFEIQGLFSLALIAAKCYAIQTERAKGGELPPIRQVFRG